MIGLVAPPIALAGGWWIFLIFVIVFFFVIVFGYYTLRGSGISQTPYSRPDGPPGSPSELAHDITQDVHNWQRGTADYHGRHRPPAIQVPIDPVVAEALRLWREGTDTDPRLRPPVGPDDHVRGPQDATTVAIYVDLASEPSRSAYQMVVKLAERRPIQLAVRHLPLVDVHPLALPAAETLEAAAAQGQFFELLDQLSQTDCNEEAQLLGIADRCVGDPERLRQEVRDGLHRPKIVEHIGQATSSGAHVVPEVYVSGIHYHGAITRDDVTRALVQAETAAAQPD